MSLPALPHPNNSVRLHRHGAVILTAVSHPMPDCSRGHLTFVYAVFQETAVSANAECGVSLPVPYTIAPLCRLSCMGTTTPAYWHT